MVKIFKRKSENTSKDGQQHGRKQKQDGRKEGQRVKKNNETTETGKDMGKSFRSKMTRLRNLSLTWVAREKRICILKDTVRESLK